MQIRRMFALSGAVAVLGLASAAAGASTAAASAAGTTVSVRVEGISHTLLRARPVAVGAGGFITRGGTPRGQCPASSAAGALGAATHGRWSGTWQAKYAALSVESVLGERHTLSSRDYWSIWVNGRYAPAGICGLALHRGEQLLFAAVPDSPAEVPIILTAPARARTGHRFTVRAEAYTANGARRPLAGLTIAGAGQTDAAGRTTVTPRRAGKLMLAAARAGYIRAEATVSVAR